MLYSYPNTDIHVLDALYYEPELASIHLIRSQDRVAVIDTGTHHSVPQVEHGLAELGLGFQHIDYVILTHIHLDHAGGAGALMKCCPDAQLVVHPRGARHMADPAKLIAGAQAVYGEENFKRLYGDIIPVEVDRIIEPQDGDSLHLAGRELIFIDTPGHASHHHCIIDTQTNSVFSGDTMGVGYKALRSADSAFVMPTTTPIQFNPDALHASIDKIMSYRPATVFLTHYSAVTPTTRMVAGLHEQIDDYVMLTEQAADTEDFEKRLAEELFAYLVRRCMNEIDGLDESVVRHWLKLDSDLNAQGLAFWWQHRRDTE